MYKTIILELLKQRPEIHNQLQSNRMLLSTLDRYARELKANHKTWKDRLSQAKPRSDQSQIASEALEIALKDLLENSSLPGFPSDKDEQLLLDRAMAFIRNHTSRE